MGIIFPQGSLTTKWSMGTITISFTHKPQVQTLANQITFLPVDITEGAKLTEADCDLVLPP